MPMTPSLGKTHRNGPDTQYTLLDVIALLRQQSFRHMVMDQVRDPVLKTWWQRYYEPMDLRFQLEVISSVVTKLSKFGSSRVSRPGFWDSLAPPSISQESWQQGQILLISTASRHRWVGSLKADRLIFAGSLPYDAGRAGQVQAWAASAFPGPY